VRQQTRNAIANGLDRTRGLRLLVDNRSADPDHYFRVGRHMFESIHGAVTDSGIDAAETRAPIYALSVFTHLDEQLQRAWVAEFHRLLRPGGRLVLSLLGSQLASRLAPEERRPFDLGSPQLPILQDAYIAGRIG